jgi:EAL domain-containing protein (putative c-di-GMP-specific phosphodiesterase class I)
MNQRQRLVVPEPAAALDTRQCWIVLPDTVRLIDYDTALTLAGWHVGRVLNSVAGAMLALREQAEAPDLIVMSLSFGDGDGDGLQLIRSLARRGHRAAVFVVSHQQRAVIKAALKLADISGVAVAGSAEEPVSATEVVGLLQGFRRHAIEALPPEPCEPPLGLAQLRGLLDGQGIEAWMQPQLRLNSGEIVGFEALMRAHDGAGKLINPDRLMPGLVEHGLLEEATLMILRQTVDFVVECLGRGMAISASVNVSLTAMSNPSFCRALHKVVVQAGLDPSWITLEITESDAMEDLAHVIENTARIRMLGFNLAIDDFGVAYSSLSQLSNIPFSELKVDRAFVQNIHLDARKQAIVRGCAALGHSLDLAVVAEGVETVDEFKAVVAAGCTRVQGYLVSRPLPVAAMADWLGALPDMVWRPPA